MSKLRVVIVPGNGCSGNVRLCNWYGWMEHELRKSGLFEEVILRNMPDPVQAREKYWIPFLLADGSMQYGGASFEGCGFASKGRRTIIVGHSSGAEAAMRLAEQTGVLGVVLVSACHTDLGEPSEAAAGYYNRPWDWARMKANVGPFGVLQFHSQDDPFIPMAEAEHVAENFGSEFFQYEHKSHFFTADQATCVLESVLARVKELDELRDDDDDGDGNVPAAADAVAAAAAAGSDDGGGAPRTLDTAEEAGAREEAPLATQQAS